MPHPNMTYPGHHLVFVGNGKGFEFPFEKNLSEKSSTIILHGCNAKLTRLINRKQITWAHQGLEQITDHKIRFHGNFLQLFEIKCLGDD